MVIRTNLRDFSLWVFSGVLLTHAASAYNFGPIPIPWVSQLAIVTLFLWLSLRRKLLLFPGFAVFSAFFLWAILVTVTNMILFDYSTLMGLQATTNYYAFVFLRLFSLVVFFSTAGVAYWLIEVNGREAVLKHVSTVAFIVAVYAIYIYLAQVYGLPEPPRTRMSTHGGIQVARYTYAFHRATGSFREPSHLAEWLIGPMFLTLSTSSLLSLIMGLTIAAVMLLTGSLTGISGSLGGFSVALLFTHGLGKKFWTSLGKLAAIVVFGSLIFTVVVVSNAKGSTDLVSVLWTRIEPILYEEGANSTNRDYVYKYVQKESFPWLGTGLGHANLKFSQALSIQATASFLNLFFNYAYSLGLIGLILCAFFLALPLIRHLSGLSTRRLEGYEMVFAAYLGWFFFLVGHTEEFGLPYGLVYGFFAYYSTHSINNTPG